MSSWLSDQALDMLMGLSTGQTQKAAAAKYPGGAQSLFGVPEIRRGSEHTWSGDAVTESVSPIDILFGGATALAGSAAAEGAGAVAASLASSGALVGMMDKEQHAGPDDTQVELGTPEISRSVEFGEPEIKRSERPQRRTVQLDPFNIYPKVAEE